MIKGEKKYLGIDWGEKRIGLALGDSLTNIATPFKVVGSIEEIEKIIEDEKVDIAIIGKPFKMQGTKIKVQVEFLSFLDLLKKRLSIPIKTIDERLSSQAADALSGNKNTKAPRDAVAAMLILQNYLNRHNSNLSPPWRDPALHAPPKARLR